MVDSEKTKRDLAKKKKQPVVASFGRREVQKELADLKPKKPPDETRREKARAAAAVPGRRPRPSPLPRKRDLELQRKSLASPEPPPLSGDEDGYAAQPSTPPVQDSPRRGRIRRKSPSSKRPATPDEPELKCTSRFCGLNDNHLDVFATTESRNIE